MNIPAGRSVAGRRRAHHGQGVEVQRPGTGPGSTRAAPTRHHGDRGEARAERDPPAAPGGPPPGRTAFGAAGDGRSGYAAAPAARRADERPARVRRVPRRRRAVPDRGRPVRRRTLVTGVCGTAPSAPACRAAGRRRVRRRRGRAVGCGRRTGGDGGRARRAEGRRVARGRRGPGRSGVRGPRSWAGTAGRPGRRGSGRSVSAPSATGSSGCSSTVGAMPSSACSSRATSGIRVEPPTRNSPASWSGARPAAAITSRVSATARASSGAASRSNVLPGQLHRRLHPGYGHRRDERPGTASPWRRARSPRAAAGPATAPAVAGSVSRAHSRGCVARRPARRAGRPGPRRGRDRRGRAARRWRSR